MSSPDVEQTGSWSGNATSVRPLSWPSARGKGHSPCCSNDIKQTELTQSERDVLKQDAARWERMGAGSRLDDWLAYYPGLAIRRTLAMRIAHANRPEGKRYAETFRELMQADGLDTSRDKTGHLLVRFCGWAKTPERMRILRELRDAMNTGTAVAAELTDCGAAERRAVLKARQGGTEEAVKVSPVALLKNQITEQARQIRHPGGEAGEAGRRFAVRSEARHCRRHRRRHHRQHQRTQGRGHRERHRHALEAKAAEACGLMR